MESILSKNPRLRKFFSFCFTPSAEGFDLRSLAFFRISLGIVIFYNLCGRFSNDGLRAFFTQEGVLPPVYPYPYLDLLSYLPTIPALIPFLVIIFLSTLSFTLGFWSRASAFILFICQVLIHYRAAGLESSGEMVLRLFLIWSVFFPIGVRYSLDAYLASRYNFNKPSYPTNNNGNKAPFTLAFVFFCFLMFLHYFLNGIQKDLGAWGNPDVLYLATMDPNISMPLGEFLKSQLPRIIFELGGSGVLFYEVLLGLFILLGIIFPFFRLPAACMIWGLHGSFIVFMDLQSFPWTYVSIGLLFMPTFVWDSLLKFFSGVLGRFVLPRPQGYVGRNYGYHYGKDRSQSSYPFDSDSDSAFALVLVNEKVNSFNILNFLPKGPYLGPLILVFFNLTLMTSYNPLCPRFLVDFSAPIHKSLYPYMGDLGLTCGWNLFRSPQYGGSTYALLGYRDNQWYDVGRARTVPWIVGSQDVVESYVRSLVSPGSTGYGYWLDYLRLVDSDASLELKQALHRYMASIRGYTQYRLYWVEYKMSSDGIHPEVVKTDLSLFWEKPNWQRVDLGLFNHSTDLSLQDMGSFETFWGSSAGHRPSKPRPSIYGGTLWPPTGEQVLAKVTQGQDLYLAIPIPDTYSGGSLPLALRLTAGPDFGVYSVYSSKTKAPLTDLGAVGIQSGLDGLTPLTTYDGYSSLGVVPRTLVIHIPESDILPLSSTSELSQGQLKKLSDAKAKFYVNLCFRSQKPNKLSKGNLLGISGYLFNPDYWSDSNYSQY